MRLGTAYVVIKAKLDDLKNDLSRARQSVNTAVSGIQKSLSRIAFTAVAVGATAATAAIVIGSKKAIDASSDLNETISKSNTIFKQNADDMRRWAENSAQTMGMSKQAALETAATLGNMFDQLGAGTEIAAKNSQAMVELSADIASFHNVSGGAEEVLNAMMSAFRGEYDALQRYIPTIKAASVQQLALAETGKTSAKELTELEKATAAMHIIISDAGVATGDFAKTSQQLANQQRILSANVENTYAAIGNGLTPMVTEVYKEINKWFLNNKDLIKQNMPSFVLKLADAVIFITKTIYAGYNAWLYFRLGMQEAIVDASKKLELMYDALRLSLRALEQIVVVMKELGFIATNPFETIKQGLVDWRLASLDVKNGILNDLKDTDEGYEKLLTTLEKVKKRMAEAASGPTSSGGAGGVPGVPGAPKSDMPLSSQISKLAEFNKLFEQMHMSQTEIQKANLNEQVQAYRDAGADEVKLATWKAAQLKKIAEQNSKDRIGYYKSAAGSISETFREVAEAGGESGKKAWAAYKATALAEAIISGYLAVSKAIATGSPPYNYIAAAVAAASSAVQVANIANATPPTYDSGGISAARGIYQTGNIMEAHVPIPSGKIPVKINGGASQAKTEVHIHVEGNTFYDKEKQNQVFTQIAEDIVWRVAPQAVAYDYSNDGVARQMVRG